MFGQVFYHDTIRKYVILFGTLFNDVYINKGDGTNTTQTIKVPISYGPKQKFLVRLEQDPGINKPVAIQLPRMAFELLDISYAAERKLPTINKISVQNPNDASKVSYQYMPVPYDLTFNLHIMVKQARDGTRILEQILPFFTPEWTATLNLDPTMQHRYDIPVVLNSVTSEDTYTGNFVERRAITWTLSFTLKGYVFGPTRSQKTIKSSGINLYNVGTPVDMNDAVGNTQIYDTITSIPTLAGKTLSEIEADDDYEITQTIEQFYDQ
jgi:hypothetical protein